VECNDVSLSVTRGLGGADDLLEGFQWASQTCCTQQQPTDNYLNLNRRLHLTQDYQDLCWDCSELRRAAMAS
jgi:hypothetical protein